MAKYGFSLCCEGFDPKVLVEQAVAAERAGFDFLVISDHFHPWLPEQEHAGFAWSILGAVAQATKTIELATMVTCPIMRYHPAVIAQAAATVGVLSDCRFTLGLGTGERLNEHVVGEGWPSATVRRERLSEAVEIIQRLWTGEYVSFQGKYFAVDDARIFDLPGAPMRMFVAAGGHESARLAAEVADGMCNTEPNREALQTYFKHGGNKQNTWAQVVTAFAPSKTAGLELAHRSFRFATGGWKVQSELPNPVNFGAATKIVKPEDLAELLPAGNDPKAFAQSIQRFTDLGVAHVAVAYPGDDLKGFLKFWQDKVRPKLP